MDNGACGPAADQKTSVDVHDDKIVAFPPRRRSRARCCHCGHCPEDVIELQAALELALRLLSDDQFGYFYAVHKQSKESGVHCG